MSEPVAQVEIEDVLSSIRRLVSEEGRKELRPAPRTPQQKPDRLILTPALRIATPADANPHCAANLADRDVPGKAVANAEDKETGRAFDMDLSKPMLLRPVDAVWIEGRDVTPANSPLEIKPAAEAEETAEDAGWQPEPAIELSQKHLADSLSAKIEALEAAIAQTEDQWEPDGESDDDYSGTWTRSLNWQDGDMAAKLEAEIRAELEASMAEPVADLMPELTDEPEQVQSDEPEVIEAQADPVVEPAEAEDTSETAASPAPAEEAVLDEETLRLMVADIVRQELQGALGERITRNVRKLVRREVHRALTAKELE
ncbi:MAG: hypothetical protein AB3N21_03490 [Ruegeria sp.]|uniref:hypothetical protein n=1 Tax=Ruegeria sp. TaxID=1879320 RepID=UPI00349EB5B0